MNGIENCFICHPSDSIVWEGTGTEPRTVAESVLTVRATSQLGYISTTTRWLPGSLFFLFLQAEDISRSLVGLRVPAVLTVSTTVKNYNFFL
jgi:hypothetical protein